MAERERRFTKATRATGTESYDPKAHQRARQRSEYLAGIAQEAEELRDGIAESRGLDKDLGQATEERMRQRAAASGHADGLKAIGLKPGELARLQAARQQAEERRDTLREDLHDAKMKAQDTATTSRTSGGA